MEGIRKNICGRASAYNTIFGWVLSGPITVQIVQVFNSSIQVSETQELNNLLRRFWEQEELPAFRTNSPDEEFAGKFLLVLQGPTLQNDLITVILNWRKYKFVFSGDIQKMYRQILVHPSDRQFQRILFQPGPDSPVTDYQLKTVTFGLWLEGLQWDEEVSQDSRESWNNLVRDLSEIETITIPRWLQYTPEDCVEIHGFSDASKSAYCAAVYIRCRTASHTTFSNLLVAKSKVAPIQTVCLPRLELNGAALLASLVNHVNANLGFNASNIYLWTDSSIVLGWLSKPPSSWETYIANRTAQIHRLVPNASWRHIPSHDNPADLGTRGSRPQDLSQNLLWWHGPKWLHKPSSEWPDRNPLKSAKEPHETLSFHTEVEAPILLHSSPHMAGHYESCVMCFASIAFVLV
ncbi:hypothetical protein EVAR_67454_1 [Eumeta japonica]|uniref:Uncharacterized protein n=1 Tax=Eumeta variegata TaxID=151549 RepID=A0A4C1T076_EUMVA|nr:hypothetical protein EVAR_67454_1 [Eumeta japonica]